MSERIKAARSLPVQYLPKALAFSLLVVLVLSGCSFSFGGSGSPAAETLWTQAIPRNFSFGTARSVDVSLDVSVSVDGVTKPYAGDIGVYIPSANADGTYELLGSGNIPVEAAGKASFSVPVPTSITMVTIRPSTFGLFEREVTIDPISTTLDVKISPTDTPAAVGAAARSLSSSARTVIGNGFHAISDFNGDGVPSALLPTREAFSQGFLDDITATLPEYVSLPAHHPTFMDTNGRSNLALTEDAEVTVTFVNEGAGYRNALGYFAYPTGTTPANPLPASSIWVAFPNTSYVGSGGGLVAGDRLKLVNPSPIAGHDKYFFKAGTTISWVIMANGYNGANVGEGYGRYYSIPSMNPDPGTSADKTHVALIYYDKPSKHTGPVLLLAFEDLARASADNDFNDVLYSVSITPTTAVNTIGIPGAVEVVDTDHDGVPDNLDAFPLDPLRSAIVGWPSVTSYGTALYEDLWPSLGDYDFNDLVSNIRTRTVKNAQGKAVEMYVDVKLRAAGGGLPSGLALALPVPSTSIASVTGQGTVSPVFSPSATNKVEADGVSSSVVPIFADSHAAFNLASINDLKVNTVKVGGTTKPELDYSLLVTFVPNSVDGASLTATPDLFAVIGGVRGHEVHIIGKKPGTRADLTLFKTVDDSSVTPDGPYYKSKAGAPWAMLIPAEMPWATERSEISTAYLKFSAWVKSGGTQYADWYQDKTGYRNKSLLY
ncbi:MAG: LruC domain-containing protein [Spirochaetota bacterium]